MHYGAGVTNCNCKADSIIDLTTFPKIITSAIKLLRTDVILFRKEAIHWQFVASKTIILCLNIYIFFKKRIQLENTLFKKEILKLSFHI